MAGVFDVAFVGWRRGRRGKGEGRGAGRRREVYSFGTLKGIGLGLGFRETLRTDPEPFLSIA